MKHALLSSPPDAEASQRDKAHESLRRLLILQRIPPGERLREPVWAKQLGVNRMALREAFARLEAEGLIERGPKTGYFVPQLSDDDIQQVHEVRAGLEAMAIERIIRLRRNSRKQLEPLHRAIDQLESMIDQGYQLGSTEADRRFHEELIEISGNRRLALIYQRAPLPMIHGSFVGTSRWEAEMRRTLVQHRVILALILKGDTRAAQEAIRAHLGECDLDAGDSGRDA